MFRPALVLLLAAPSLVAQDASLEPRPDLPEYLEAPTLVGGGEDKAMALAQRITSLRPVDGLLLQAEVAFHASGPRGRQGLHPAGPRQGRPSYEAHMGMASYRRALAAKPKALQAHAGLAAILAEQGRWTELESTLAKAKQAVPANLLSYHSAGRNLVYENKHLNRLSKG